jgi:hypothetical protein
VKISAAVPLEDSRERLREEDPTGRSVDDYVILFPDTEKKPTYDIFFEDVDYGYDKPGIPRECATETKGTRGWQEMGKIAIVMDEKFEPAHVQQVIKHEVQHVADRHEEEAEELGKPSRKNLAKHAVLDFRTEFRAHDVMGLPLIEDAPPDRRTRLDFRENMPEVPHRFYVT